MTNYFKAKIDNTLQTSEGYAAKNMKRLMT